MTKFTQLLQRYADPLCHTKESNILVFSGAVGLAAELAKKSREIKSVHEMLTEAGVPETSAGSGERICLEGRVALLLMR